MAIPEDEITDNRPCNYSRWRRSIKNNCYMVDGDWFELRANNGLFKAVCYIETIQIPSNKSPADYPIWNAKRSLAEQISREMNIPAFFVWHDEECKYFYIQNVNSNNCIKLSRLEYIQFLKGFKLNNINKKHNQELLDNWIH